MKRIIKYFFVLLLFFGVVANLGNERVVYGAETKYFYSRNGKGDVYSGQEIFVISEDVTDEDFLGLGDYGDKMYYMFEPVKKIIFAEGVTTIPNTLLDTCFPNVEIIQISNTVKSIPDGLYLDSSYNSISGSKLKAIYVAGDNKYFISVKGVLYDKKKTLLCAYPSGATRTSYVIPDSVKSVKENAFVNARNLKKVTFGKNFVGTNVGEVCWALPKATEFVVAKGNRNLCSKNGVIFSKKGDTLKAVPRGKSGEYTIPKGTATIGDYAFYGSGITKLTIPNGVKKLGKNVFWHTAIQKLSIPDTLNSSWNEYGLFENLQEITVSGKNKTYASYDGILYDKKLTKIVYFPPEYKKDVLRYPDTVTVVDLEMRNKNVKEVMISKYVKEIHVFVGEDDYLLEKVTVDSENPYYSSFENSLYNKAQTELLLFTKNETANFPDTLTEISVTQLLDSGVKKIKISKNVQKIGSHAHCNLFEIPTLRTVIMDADNPYYTYENGLLMNKQKTILYDIDSSMEELMIPDTVEEMDSFNCLSYGSLKRISIPAKLKKIEFEDNKTYDKLGEIVVNSENKNLSAKSGVLYNKDQSELIYYPENKMDKAYVMPETVVSGDLLSVLKNPYVESITLSEKFKMSTQSYINKESLPAYSDHCLKEFIVGEKSEYFKTVDGVLYDKDMTKLIAYPPSRENTEFAIPDTVETAYGLTQNPYLEKLHIGKSLKAWLWEDQYPEAQIFLTSLQTIETDKENAFYTAIDGVLYDKGLTKMIVYPDDCRNKVLTIPKTLSKIFVFYNEFPYYMNVRVNPYLKEIKVEKGNTTFGTDGKYVYTRCGRYPFFQNE